MDKSTVLLDTSFLIRLLNDGDKLHRQTYEYFRHFLSNGNRLKLSTISLAEYCVRGSVEEIPLRNLEILPFNFDHGICAGQFARIIFNKRGQLTLPSRLVIPNDTKLFAQAERDRDVRFFATSDAESLKIIELLKSVQSLTFEPINIRNPLSSFLGQLPFE